MALPGGNSNPVKGNNPDEYEEWACPFCGADGIKKPPAHLVKCPET